MWKNQKCTLTTKDILILEALYDRRHRLSETVERLLKHKLDLAVVVFCEDIGSDVVTLNTRLQYRIGDTPSRAAILTQGALDGTVGHCLPLTTLRGLACLGLTQGAGISLPGPNGATPDRLVVEKILYQPEAARRDRRQQQSIRRVPRLVHSVDADVDTPPDRLRK
ncbi:hypothetical protein [Hoeflea sp. BAL378]|uniref:hypothetical protein n=1 Tax=Hoeflea sp. BAL378 TaxID=1547437 RepID=UPI00068C0BF7|nr:hypothetical protein [Hoeflea sp. BAL378]